MHDPLPATIGALTRYFILGGERSMDTVELTFKYTQAEFVNGDRQYLIASKTISKTNIVVLAVLLPTLLLYLFLSSFIVLAIAFTAVGVVAAITGSILYFYIPFYKFKITRKYNEEYTLTFSNSGITFKTLSIDSTIKWNMYSEIWESNDFYFLIQGPRVYSLIPKRAFGSPVEMRMFEEISISNMKCSKRTV